MTASNRAIPFRTGAAASLLAAAALAAASCARPPETRRPGAAAVSSAPRSVPRFGLFELALRDRAAHRNPFIDVDVKARLVSPGGAVVSVPGFYYGRGVWMVRFRPYAAGRWTYRWEFAGNGGRRFSGDGSFDCTLPDGGKGRVRRDPSNPQRWVFENGQPYFPIGIQEGAGTNFPGVHLIDGQSRQGPWRTVSTEQYFQIYGQAGFNLFRFSQRNVSYSLFDDLDHYRERESLATDRLLEIVRRNGFRVMFGFFGYYGKWAEGGTRLERVLYRLRRLEYLLPSEAVNHPRDTRTIEKEKRFVRYCVARWGVYSDFWELLNERHASAEWVDTMAAYVHSIDPDRKPVSTSWERPELPEIDLNAPHWYEAENELESDLRVRQQAVRWKAFGKPVLVGEQGNMGMNWDPRSAVRMRIRLWTSLFQEIGLIFWNTSWSKAGMNQGRYTPENVANLYLGPEERSYVRVLSDFSARLDTQVRMAPVSVAGGGVRAYGLVSPGLTAAYLVHYTNRKTAATGVRISLPLPPGRSLAAQWIDPASGKVLGSAPLRAGETGLPAPPFQVDIVLMVTGTPAGKKTWGPARAPVNRRIGSRLLSSGQLEVPLTWNPLIVSSQE